MWKIQHKGASPSAAKQSTIYSPRNDRQNMSRGYSVVERPLVMSYSRILVVSKHEFKQRKMIKYVY